MTNPARMLNTVTQSVLTLAAVEGPCPRFADADVRLPHVF